MAPGRSDNRLVSRVELMVHPFYDLYRAKPHVSAKQLAHMVEKWKQRVREVAADPGAVLVVSKSRCELGEEEPDYEGFKYRSKAELQKMLAMERAFYEYAKRCLEKKGHTGISTPGNRLFLGLEDSLLNSLDSQRFKEELEKRKMRLAKSPVFWLYGSYSTACVPLEFAGIERVFRINAKSKVVFSLSLPYRRPVNKEVGISGYRPKELRWKPGLRHKTKRHFH